MSSNGHSTNDHEPDNERSSRWTLVTNSSDRFQESTHLIPDRPNIKRKNIAKFVKGKHAKRYDPLIMRLPVVIGTPISMLLLGVGLEAALMISERNQGFPVPIENKLQFLGSTQFLLSFIPTLFIIPVAFLWRELDWMVRWYQPYVILSNGHAPAEETLLLDYIAIGVFFTLFYSLRFKHKLIFVSALTAAATYLLQPLAGSVFALTTIPYTSGSTVVSTKSIGLSPDVGDLSAFVAAAGYAEAAVFHGLGDPPFVKDGWATAEFAFPKGQWLNGTMDVNTTGVQTNPNCAGPTSDPQVKTLDNGTFQITAPSPQSADGTVVGGDGSAGCWGQAQFNPNDAVSQYGVVASPCGSKSNVNVTFQPVMFWYFQKAADGGSNRARTVFCSPSISPFNVAAHADLVTGAMANCTKIGDYPTGNNVTGAPLSGQAFNGVVFEPNTSPFINARASATQTGVPGAVFRFASQLPGGPDATFDSPNGFLDLTVKVYTQHLAVSAKSIYFVSQNNTLDSRLTSMTPRLRINPIPAHFLSLILFLIGLAGTIVHVANRRMRKNLVLSAPPGTIAHTVALTARSGFGDLLYPYDTAEEITDKLRGLYFRMDKRTGAIVADDYGEDFAYPLSASSKDVTFVGSPTSAKHKSGSGSDYFKTPYSDEGHEGSSSMAMQVAAGMSPWEQGKGGKKYKTPFDK